MIKEKATGNSISMRKPVVVRHLDSYSYSTKARGFGRRWIYSTIISAHCTPLSIESPYLVSGRPPKMWNFAYSRTSRLG